MFAIAPIYSHAKHSSDAFLVVFGLWFFNGLLFGVVQISYVV
ncbi:MAG: hypothetical protein AAF252_08050 [Pseudomonadota bacterium]